MYPSTQVSPYPHARCTLVPPVSPYRLRYLRVLLYRCTAAPLRRCTAGCVAPVAGVWCTSHLPSPSPRTSRSQDSPGSPHGKRVQFVGWFISARSCLETARLVASTFPLLLPRLVTSRLLNRIISSLNRLPLPCPALPYPSIPGCTDCPQTDRVKRKGHKKEKTKEAETCST